MQAAEQSAAKLARLRQERDNDPDTYVELARLADHEE
jgi:hypothetical protein